MVDYQTISIVLTGIGLMIALTYYSFQIRNQNRTRQAQLHIQIFNELNSNERWKEFLDAAYHWEWEDFDDFHVKYGRGNPEVYAKLTSMWWIYNSVGTLLIDGFLDAKKLYPLMGPMVIMQWDRWKSIVLENRLRIDQPEAFIHFEYLAKAMLRVRKSGYRDEYVSKIIQMEP